MLSILGPGYDLMSGMLFDMTFTRSSIPMYVCHIHHAPSMHTRVLLPAALGSSAAQV